MKNDIFRKIKVIIFLFLSIILFKSLSYGSSYPSIEILNQKARKFVKLGWNSEALKIASFLKNTDAETAAYEIESSVYLMSRKYYKALNPCKYLYRMDKYNYHYFNNLLDCYLKMAMYDEAEKLLIQGVQSFSNKTGLLLKLSNLIKNTKGQQEALPYLLYARKIEPYDKNILLNTGLAYHKLNKDDLSLHYLEAASKTDTNDEWLKHYLRIIRDIKKDKSQAMNVMPRHGLNYSQQMEAFGAVAKSESFTDMEREIDQSIYTGDQFGLVNNIEKLLIAYPAEPESFLYYNAIYNLSHILGFDRAVAILKRLINSVNSRENLEGKNLYNIYLKLQLEKLLYDYRKPEAEKLSIEFSSLRQWLLIGPYLKYGAGDIDYSFIPEIMTNITNSEHKKEVYIREPKGSLNIGKYIYPEKGIIYAAATINCDQPFKVRIYSDSPYKLFINGKETLRNLRPEVYRNLRIVKIWDSSRTTIMIKFHLNGNKTLCRVLITDLNDRIINPGSSPPDLIFSSFNSSEEMDYPYAFFNNARDVNVIKKNDIDFRLGRYFHDLFSFESVKYYKKTVSADNPVRSFSYAEFLYENHDSNGFAPKVETADIIENLSRYPDFIPAQRLRLEKLIKSSDTSKIYLEYQNILLQAAAYLPLRMDYASFLLHCGYEKEFEKEINLITERFPHAVQPLSLLARYYRKKNISRCIDINKKILTIKNSVEALKCLIDIYKEQGRHEDIKVLINNFDSKDLFKKEYIDSLFDTEDYEAAKKEIFKEILIKEDPHYYAKLGEMNYIQGIDPMMYWQKSLSIYPSNYLLCDFMDYFKSRKIENWFEAYSDNNISEELSRVSAGKKIKPSRDQYKSMVFLLYADGGSRVFCEDLIYIADQEILKHWQKFTIPFPITGEANSVIIRIYNKDGSYSDSFNISNNNIFLPSLSVGSTAYISYSIDNPVKKFDGSSFFAIPYIKTGLTAARFVLKVIAPKEMKLKFFLNYELEIKSVILSGGSAMHTAEIDNGREMKAGEAKSDIISNQIYFSVSSIHDIKDLILWYKGLLQGTNNIDISVVQELFPRKTARELVESVYYFVNNNFAQQNRILFSPRKAMDTFYRKAGSSEDKVILASSMLGSMGIKSYIGLAGRHNFFNDGSFVSPYGFTDILLYVPLDIKKGLWLNFSDTNYNCGKVCNSLIGRDAVVIIKDNFEIKKISSAE